MHKLFADTNQIHITWLQEAGLIPLDSEDE